MIVVFLSLILPIKKCLEVGTESQNFGSGSLRALLLFSMQAKPAEGKSVFAL